MAGPLMHTVTIEADPEKIYEAISTGKGLASFWTRESHAEPKVGSTATFGFGGPKLELKVAELKPRKLVRWSSPGGFPGWEDTSITWEMRPRRKAGRRSGSATRGGLSPCRRRSWRRSTTRGDESSAG